MASKKGHRSGGKFCSAHTTYIELAEMFADVAAAHKDVTTVSANFIKSGLPPANGQRRVKITDIQGGILLSVRDNIAHQEVRIFTNNIHETKLTLSKAIRNKGIHLCFGKQADDA